MRTISARVPNQHTDQISTRTKSAHGPYQRYDKVVDMHNDLSDFSSDDPPPRGKQWFVTDKTISAGSAHAGFPMMFWNYDLASLDKPFYWGVLHELGHNYQQWNFWSFAYGSESTVNLFSVHAKDVLGHNDDFGGHEGIKYRKAAENVDNGMTFEKADAWDKLVFLLEILRAFPKVGWEMIRVLNRRVRAMDDAEAEKLSKDRQAQMDYVCKTLSEVVGQDLRGTYDRWGIKLSDEAKEHVAKMNLRKAPADLSVRN